MKDSRFIELLNLYIDRQISAEETAELESEIQSSPQRQAVYHQYCKIHTATKQVYASFRANSSEQPVVEPGHTGVIELFESRRRRAKWAYYASGIAAAACLALVFMRHSPTAVAEAPVLAATPRPAPAIASPSAVPVVAKVPVSVAPADLMSLRNAVAPTPEFSTTLVALREQDEERAFSTERVYVDGAPSLFPDEVFAGKRALTPQEQRVFRSRQAPSASPQAQAEFSAFQFQR